MNNDLLVFAGHGSNGHNAETMVCLFWRVAWAIDNRVDPTLRSRRVQVSRAQRSNFAWDQPRHLDTSADGSIDGVWSELPIKMERYGSHHVLQGESSMATTPCLVPIRVAPKGQGGLPFAEPLCFAPIMYVLAGCSGFGRDRPHNVSLRFFKREVETQSLFAPAYVSRVFASQEKVRQHLHLPAL